MTLGDEYTGSRISRDALLEDESDDDPFSRKSDEEGSFSHDEESTVSDEEMTEQATGGGSEIGGEDEAIEGFEDDRFTAAGFKLQDNLANGDYSENTDSASQVTGGAMETPTNRADGQLSLSSEDDEDEDIAMDDTSASESETTSSSSEAPSLDGASQTKQSAQRAELRKMMADSQRAIVSNISAAAKADAAKGKAIKKQRSTFDSLLNTRIRLQKALIATNSLTVTSNEGVDTKAIEAAEQAALNLWNTIDSLRRSLPGSTFSPSTTPITATTTTPLPTLWTATHSPTAASRPQHRATLMKWSQKINPPAASLLQHNKFSQTPSQQPLTAVLDAQLVGSQGQKNIDKARAPRSCAPLQAQANKVADGEQSGGVYDDSDFYTTLLRELVEQRMGDSASTASLPATEGTKTLLPGMKDRSLRVKKNVDTKASKGRKMRYTVHEKLQNFMAPEDRGSWGERQREELFGGLLGRKVEMREGEDGDGEDGVESEEDGMDGDEDGRREEEALMLFRR